MVSFDPETLLGEATLADRDHETMSVEAPFTGEEFATLPLGDERDVAHAFERAREAQSDWEARDPAERAELLLEYHDLLFDHSEPLLDLVVEESGKARRHGFEELIDTAMASRHYAHRVESYLDDESRKSPMPGLVDVEVNYRAKGVVGVISPWNYPLTLAVSDAVAALLAGNTVVLKPAEQTAYTALAAVALLREAGVPEDVMQVVPGTGPDVGEPLVEESDYLCFTGSSKTGSFVASKAGEQLIDCSLELGGKNPFIVLDDADVDEAARGATTACFANAGQLCLSAERILVHESVYEPFLEAFVDETRRLTLGTAYDYEAEIGSLIDAAQLDRVRSRVEAARESGATVHTGGRHRPDVGPYCYEPTILTDVDPDSQVACEETFGPVVSVQPVESTDAAVVAANDSPYGLNASVWTGDRSRGQRVARRVDCGTVCVNDGFAVGWGAVDAPMGGVGDSGLGRRQGEEGIKRYLEARTVATSRVGPLVPPKRIPMGWVVEGVSTARQTGRRLTKAVRSLRR